MKTLTYSLIAIVALAHFFFLTQQIFQWDKGRKRFDNFSDGQIAQVLASNQGLYNGFKLRPLPIIAQTIPAIIALILVRLAPV